MAALAFELSVHINPTNIDDVIGDALRRAQATGLSPSAAARRAAQAVRMMRPDLTPDEAWSLVELSGPASGGSRIA